MRGEKGGKRGKGVIIINNLFLVSPHGTFTFKALPSCPFIHMRLTQNKKGKVFPPPLYNEGMEVQRGKVTYSRSHSLRVTDMSRTQVFLSDIHLIYWVLSRGHWVK